MKKLFYDDKFNVQIKGILLVRARNANNMLLKKCDELYALVKARADTKGKLPDVDDFMVTRPLSSVICTRDIIFTNQPFLAHSFREKCVGYKSWTEVEEKAELVCRYKFVIFYDTVKWNVPSEALVRLRRHECDSGVPDVQLMLDWHSPSASSTNKRHRTNVPAFRTLAIRALASSKEA